MLVLLHLTQITLHGFMSESLSKTDAVTLKSRQSQAKMTETEAIQEVVNQATIQAATVVLMALGGVDVGPHLAPTANLRQQQWQRHGRPVLEKPLFNWSAQDRYV